MNTNGIKVLVGCEESQAVTIAFRERGFEAYSCDLQECSGGHPEWHIHGDVFNTIGKIKPNLFIGFPPCTFLTISANRWYKDNHRRYNQRIDAAKFFIDLYFLGGDYIALENPIGVMSGFFRKPDQIIQPWQFGHGETKATCLWLKNLPPLFSTEIVTGREQKVWKMPPGPERAKLRSKTFPGIAKAMATQWGDFLIQQKEKAA